MFNIKSYQYFVSKSYYQFEQIISPFENKFKGVQPKYHFIFYFPESSFQYNAASNGSSSIDSLKCDLLKYQNVLCYICWTDTHTPWHSSYTVGWEAVDRAVLFATLILWPINWPVNHIFSAVFDTEKCNC